ncbi:MAG: hypothetical protein WC828_03055 [Thermoleophilia bacterium]
MVTSNLNAQNPANSQIQAGGGQAVPPANYAGNNAMPYSQAIPGAVPAALAPGITGVVGRIFQAKFLAFLVVALVASVSIYHFVLAEPKPVDTVNKFVNAVNEKDINTAVSCLDPKYEKAYNATSGIIGGLTGVELTDIADLFPALISISGTKADLQMKIVNVESETVQGEYTMLKTQVEARGTDENGRVTSEQGPVTFKMKKFNDGWRIVDMIS